MYIPSSFKLICFAALGVLFSACGGPEFNETKGPDFNLVSNDGGAELGYSPESGVKILTVERKAFKDLNQNGTLDPYEDWRLSAEARATDLASRMSIDQIAGLMLYSNHQRIPGGGFRGATYGGKPYAESGKEAHELTDQQVKFLTEDNLRHVLYVSVESPAVAARWNNNAQALVEGIGLGIPANNSTDPRHQAENNDEFNIGAGGDISRWPNALGITASFDPGLMLEFGEIASSEYRALGIATALSPQVDLATDPRWYRFNGTFGPDPTLATDMARAYVDGFQTTKDANGWGNESVNAMVKHWPGGGTGEAGRDAHYGFGKFAVFPGNNLADHLKPFVEGAFKLNGGTGSASAVMPYYTVSTGLNPSGENVGNAFSSYFINDMLRGKYGYDGVICTDWGVTREDGGMADFGATPWGVEGLTEAERHYRVLMAGCDQFGGNNASGPVIEAYKMGVKDMGEEAMRARMNKSAVRLLKNILNVGLFENPYLDVANTEATVGKPEFMEAGYAAQLRSLVLLKNESNVLPLKESSKVYVPQRYNPPTTGFFGPGTPGGWAAPVDSALLSRYFSPVGAADAEVAIVFITDPQNGRTAGYSAELAESGDNGFLPISLQYDAYRAAEARDPSLAGDSRKHDVLNRTYKNKLAQISNKSDLELVLKTVREMGEKPVIVVLSLSNPTVVAEFEQEVDGLLIDFGVQRQAVLDMLAGKATPSGLLPLQMPANMATVEQQFEDVPLDMTPHKDASGNTYDFGFGMNWEGTIKDERTAKYKKTKPSR